MRGTTKRLGSVSAALALSTATLLVGCRTETPGAGASAGAAAPPERAQYRAVIKGRIVARGAPVATPVSYSKDPYCAAKNPTPVPDESFVVGEGLGLGNVVVEIARGPAAWKAIPGEVPTTPFVLLMRDCRFEPRVFALRAGTPLEVRNLDQTHHNFHWYAEANREWVSNFAVPAGADPRTVVWKEAEPDPVGIKCDVHPWMTAYARVLKHDWFRVTASDGRYEFQGLPPGDYVLHAWHERFEGPRKIRATVDGPDAVVELGR